MTSFSDTSGDEGIRTPDPLLARQVLSQLSYAPLANNPKDCAIWQGFMSSIFFASTCLGLSGLEPPTSRLSGVRSNRLSYKPAYASLGEGFIKNFIFYKAGSHLFSHTVSSAVPSAAYVLTIVFGMGTGVSHKRIATGRFYAVTLNHTSSDAILV